MDIWTIIVRSWYDRGTIVVQSSARPSEAFWVRNEGFVSLRPSSRVARAQCCRTSIYPSHAFTGSANRRSQCPGFRGGALSDFCLERVKFGDSFTFWSHSGGGGKWIPAQSLYNRNAIGVQSSPSPNEAFGSEMKDLCL